MKRVPQLKKKPAHILTEDSLAAALNWDKLGLTDDSVYPEDKKTTATPIEDLIQTIEGR